MECHKGFFRCSAELGRFCDSQRDDHKKKTPGPNGQAPSTWWLCLRSPQGTVSGIIKKSDLTLLFFLFVFLLNRFITQLDWKLVSWGRKSIFLYILNFQHLVGGLAWKYSWVFFLGGFRWRFPGSELADLPQGAARDHDGGHPTWYQWLLVSWVWKKERWLANFQVANWIGFKLAGLLVWNPMGELCQGGRFGKGFNSFLDAVWFLSPHKFQTIEQHFYQYQ